MFLMPWETIYSVDRAAFKISNQRLSRQRKIKQSESQEPLVDMIKCEVEHQRLAGYVVMLSWWMALMNDICSVMEDFLEFVDHNQMGEAVTVQVQHFIFSRSLPQSRFQNHPLRTLKNAFGSL